MSLIRIVLNSNESIFLIYINKGTLKNTDDSCAESDRNKRCDSSGYGNFFTLPTMTALTFFGALFTAYGIPLSLLVFTTIVKRVLKI